MQDPVAPLHGRRFYVFGPFRVDPANRLLLRDGQTVPLTPKVFDLLLYFVEHDDRLLTKEETLANVWPDSFVEEGNLARHVSMLRKALDEGPKDHAYIVTVSGRGYRFVAHVSTVTEREGWKPADLRAVTTGAAAAAALPEPEAEPVVEAPPYRLFRSYRIGIALAGVAIVALASAYWLRSRTAPTPPDPLTLEWRTNTGDVYSPAISRDGAYLAYCWVAPDGGQGLRVRHVAGGNTIDVVPVGPASYWSIRFSARGDFIYYVLSEPASNSVGALFRVPTLGGRQERLLDRVNGGLAPSPDGTRIGFVRLNATPATAEIMTVGADGGEPRSIVSVTRPAVVQSLNWSPDGLTLIYALRQREAAGDRWHVAEVPAAGGSPAVIVPKRSTRILAALWLPDRRGLLMNADDPESGLPQLWRVSHPDGAERRLTNDLHNYKDVTITADGGTVAVQSLGHFVQLWTAPGDAPAQPKQIASGTARGVYDALAWTSDHQLLFRWGERGFYDLWRMAPDGSARRQLTSGARDASETSVSPDGRLLFFVSTRSGSPQIWRMRPDGSDPVQLTHLKSLPLSPIVSADGRWVYFSADDRGFPTLWRMPIDGGPPAEVSPQPIEQFDLSPDGKRLAYSYRDPDRQCVRVAVVAVDGTAAATHFDIEPTFMLRWTPDGSGLAFTHEQGNIWIQPVNGDAPYPLTRQQPGFRAVSFAWSPGARHLAYTLLASPVDAIAFNVH